MLRIIEQITGSWIQPEIVQVKIVRTTCILARPGKPLCEVTDNSESKSMPYTFCRPEDVDILVLDQEPDAALVEVAKKAGMDII